MKDFLVKIRKNKVFMLMLMPAVVYVVVFAYLPMSGIVMAFKNFNYAKGIFGSDWCGFDNFKFLMISGKLWTLSRNTILYNLAFILVGMVFEVGFAIIINELTNRYFKKIFQSFMFLPYFISWVVAKAIIQAVFDYDYGLFNSFLSNIHLDRLNLYTDSSPWPYLLVFFRIWKATGYGSIVYMAAVASLNQDMYEAASIDGANVWQKIFKITLPNLAPTMFIMGLLSVGQIFRGDFGMFYQLIGNNGVLLEVGDMLDLFIYRSMASGSNLGMASAAGLYQSVLCFVTIILVNWVVKKNNPDNSLF
jgi:putative aldouronate transport system permease protein